MRGILGIALGQVILRSRAGWAGVGAAVAIVLTSACAQDLAGQQPASGQVVISIVGTNDLHGGILPREGRGGLALLSGYVKNLRAVRERDGGAVLLVDGGDMFQGTLESNLTEGASVVAAYNTVGYTAAAIGNHEFDFGPVGPASVPSGPHDDPRGALKARAAEAAFPFLAANLIDRSTGQPVAWPNVKPSTTVDAAGVKVGIIGVITRDTLHATRVENLAGLDVAPLAPAIAAHASRLRKDGAEMIIVAAHAGGRCANLTAPRDTSTCDQAAEIVGAARELPRGLVDVIVAGHTHAGMAHEIEGIAVVESFSGGRSFGRVDVFVDRARRAVVDRRIFPPQDLCERVQSTGACDSSAVPSKSSAQATYEGLPVTPDPVIARVLEPALERVRALKSQPIGVAVETRVRRITPTDAPLGNLFTDALRESVPGADAALHNVSGGLRIDFVPGPLTYGSIYEVMPFDNKVVTLRTAGRELRAVFANHFATTRRVLGVSGLRVRGRCAGASLDVSLIRPSGARVADDETLTVVVTDFLATGGDGILKPIMPEQGFPVAADAPLARDVLADYLRHYRGPIREDRLVTPGNPRVLFQGTLPASCTPR